MERRPHHSYNGRLLHAKTKLAKGVDAGVTREDDAQIREQRMTPRRIVSLVLYALLLIALGASSAAGYCTAQPQVVAVTAAIVVACAVVSQARPRVVARIAALPLVARGVLTVLVLAIAVVLCTVSIEVPWNGSVTEMAPEYVELNLIFVGLLLVGLFFLGQRHGAFARIGAGACMVFGLAEYFVYLFKGTVIIPTDVLSLETALSVSSQYTYTVSASALAGLCCGLVGWQLLSLLVPHESASATDRTLGVIANTLAAILCFTAFGYVFTQVDFEKEWGIEIDNWFVYDSFCNYGFIPSFAAYAQSMEVEQPEGYTPEKADELLATYDADYDESSSTAAQEQFSETKPTVITVMNETFTDLSTIYGDLDAGYEGTSFYKNEFTDTLEKGQLFVSASGGGTCNSEFEYLTGLSLSLMGAGQYPYELYSFKNCDSLVSQFKAQGYTATAMHPNSPSNWRRKNVYSGLGFDSFLSIDDFEGADTYRGLVSDEATYDKVLDLLEENDDPQFIFDVTMQNHSGYDTGLVPENDQLDYKPASYDDSSTNAELNEYLASINESDRALKEFVTALEKLDRPVVLVFFGDHQPGFSSAYNDALFSNEKEGIDHYSRIYRTNYSIWANYDVAGTPANGDDDGETSVCYLGAELAQTIGLPLTDYQKAQLVLERDLPLVNVFGYRDGNGTWHDPGVDEKGTQAYSDSLTMEYRRVKTELLD